MKESRKNRVLKNIGISFLVKFLMFAIGIVIPRLLIIEYGSEINGLLATVSNIYSYLALIQAGVGAAATQALYKPLAENNHKEISRVLVATRNYYRKLTVWYTLGVLLFAIIFPLVVKTTISNWVIIAIILLSGTASILTYWFLSALQALMAADGREYVAQTIQFVVFIMNSVVKIALVLSGAHILIVEVAYLIINILQMIVYRTYVYKKYPWIDWSVSANEGALNKRKSFLLNGVAWTVFNSTDTIIISTFCGLMLSSVYAMYNMVFSNLNLVLVIFYNSIYFILGQVYHENRNKYLKMHDGLESITMSLVFGVLSVAYILILPFLTLYTAGVKDISYVDTYLPALFCGVQILSNCRMISGNLINLTNQPQLTNKASIVEVFINLSLSIVLGKTIGLHGVLFATIVALTFKTNYIIIVSNRKILKRSPSRTYLTIGVNVVLFVLTIIFTQYVDLHICNYGDFLLWGGILSVTVIPLYFLINLMTNKNIIALVKDAFGKKQNTTLGSECVPRKGV